MHAPRESPAHGHFSHRSLRSRRHVADAFTTIHRAYCHTLPQFGLPAPSAEQVRRAVGGGLENAMGHFVAPELVAEACRLHVAYTEQIQLEDPTVYAGGRELVAALRAQGIHTGVLTNKIGDHARAILAHLGLAPQLDLVLGARDCPWRKPAADFTGEALHRLGADSATTCLVGDSPFDLATAANAGMPCFCVTTGTHDEAALRAAGATEVYPDLRSLSAGVFGLRLP
ncbi:MAG: HAD family hydrolase [Opitutaceae bacterium]|nr:HAD family hydrolase [Opitutaceae bacterium]